MKKIFIFFIISIFTINVNANEYDDVTFIRCIDGDTAVFKLDEKEIKVRFLAIDAPEVNNNIDAEPYASEASNYTCERLNSASEIRLEYDINASTDNYDRVLAWVWIDKNLLQQELIENGYAKVAYVYGNYKYANSLCKLEKLTQEQRIGIWSIDAKDEYCYKVDTSYIVNNINYDNIGFVKKEDKQEKKEPEVIEKMQKISDKMDEYTSENSSAFNKVVLYIMIVCAFIYVVSKEL